MTDSLFNKFTALLTAPISLINNPDTRIYYLYLLSSLMIAISFYFAINTKNTKASIQELVRYFFPKKIWLHPSSKMDYFIFMFNGILSLVLITPYIISSAAIFTFTFKSLKYIFGNPEMFEISSSSILILYTVSLWLFGDFTRFLAHYLMHKIPSLWEFHKVHHSAEVLTPLTQYRSHPIEVFIFNLRAVFSVGLITGIFTYFFSYDLTILEIIGVNIFRFIFLALGANLRHSHIPLRYGKFLEHIFISPAQHQIHHSNDPKHFDTNMGSHLAIWDWFFGTLQTAKSGMKLIFGLDQETNQDHRNLWKIYLLPFTKIFNSNK